MQRVTASGAGKAAFDRALLIRDQDCTPPSGFCRPTGDFIARSIPMMDVVMLAIGFVFFALSISYVYACDRL
jgi:hypothetical protein